MMYIDEFQRILDSSRKNALTVFVGAGVSKLSKAPTWKDLIDSFCNAMGLNNNVSADDYLRIPQMYYYSVGKNNRKYYSFINDFFNCTALKPNSIHKLLLELQPHSFITTNFDDLLEKASIQCGTSYKTVACDKEVPKIYGDKYILKIHGDLKHRNIVLKEEDYLSYSDDFKLIETLLKSIFSTNTVLMVGYGLNDYNIKLVLNWAKNLLKDHFNKPIFIYTDDKKLKEEELIYHCSQGLNVIEYYKCDGFVEAIDEIKYENRYRTVLKAIQKSSAVFLDGKNKEELFDVLFSRLAPLNEMWALKTSDIHERLKTFAIVDQTGIIIPRSSELNIFERFLEINQMDCTQRMSLSDEVLDKYHTIISVFSKGLIMNYKSFSFINLRDIEYSFADSLCLTFDYMKMNKFVVKKYATIYDDYKKAFYLAKLRKYEKAFELFGQVAFKAFSDQNYLLYYLAQTNKYNVYKAIETTGYYNVKLNDEEKIGMSSEQVEHLFDNLPHEFQKTYACFKDIASSNLLYKNAYESLVDNKKFQEKHETNTFEMGITSMDNVIARLNGNLHFLLGNGLYIDEYVEFKNTVIDVMERLVFKYSIQNREISSNQLGNEIIIFNYVDFYCFMEYFKAQELVRLFNKYDVKELEFDEPEIIYMSIINIMDYYEHVLSKNKDQNENIIYHNKIKSLMVIVKYFSIPQDLMDRLCTFILKYDFYEIYINDKIHFLDFQIVNRKMSSCVTSAIIENCLMDYLGRYIELVDKGGDIEQPSTVNDINYYNLIHYILPRPSAIRLAKKINRMLDIGIEKFPLGIFEHCYRYLTNNMKMKIVKNIKALLHKSFDFKYFNFLIVNDIKIDRDLIKALKLYLGKLIEPAETLGGLETYPKNSKYADLIIVGYWCLVGALPAMQFKKFVGYSDNFDFYYLYDKFDFDKFDVKWLLNLNERNIVKICENDDVKLKLRMVVAASIRDKKLSPSDERKLVRILTCNLC